MAVLYSSMEVNIFYSANIPYNRVNYLKKEVKNKAFKGNIKAEVIKKVHSKD